MTPDRPYFARRRHAARAAGGGAGPPAAGGAGRGALEHPAHRRARGAIARDRVDGSRGVRRRASGHASRDAGSAHRPADRATAARATGGGQVLYKMHYQLAYIPYDKRHPHHHGVHAGDVRGDGHRHHRAQEHLQGLLHVPAAQGAAQLARRPQPAERDGAAVPSRSSRTAASCSSRTSSCRRCRTCSMANQGRSAALQFYQGTYPYPSPHSCRAAANAAAPLASLGAADGQRRRRMGRGHRHVGGSAQPRRCQRARAGEAAGNGQHRVPREHAGVRWRERSACCEDFQPRRPRRGATPTT